MAPSPPKYNTVDIGPFMMAFGKVTYTYAGHMGLPTVHIDMEDRKNFYKAVIISFSRMYSTEPLPVLYHRWQYFVIAIDSYVV
jgi:hypothetical protein